VCRRASWRRFACRNRPFSCKHGCGAHQLRPRDTAHRLAKIILMNRAVAFAMTVLLITPLRADASGLDLFGFGARSSALAGAGSALVDGYDAVYENPAGLAGVRTRRLTLGYVYGHFHLDFGGGLSDDAPEDTHATVIGG